MTTGCRNDLVKEALESIRSALVEYLKASCRRSLPMVRLTGQRKVRIEFYGLFNYYEGTENFPRFMDAYSYALQCAGLDSVFRHLKAQLLMEGGLGTS